MARAYSVDLRERVVEYVHNGGDRAEACDIFQIGIAMLQRWLSAKKKTGELAPKKLGSRPWKLDHAAVVAYVESHEDSTLQEIAQYFDTAVSAIDYILRKFKITRKKNDALRRARRSRAAKIPR
jgi:transposase